MNVATLDNTGTSLSDLIRKTLHRIRPHRPQQPTHRLVTICGELPHHLTAARIRTAFLPTVRHGYQPEAVRQLLTQAADEITRLHQRLATVYAENDRIKTALKQWQSDHAATCHRTEPDTRTHWPVNSSPAPGSRRARA